MKGVRFLTILAIGWAAIFGYLWREYELDLQSWGQQRAVIDARLSWYLSYSDTLSTEVVPILKSACERIPAFDRDPSCMSQFKEYLARVLRGELHPRPVWWPSDEVAALSLRIKTRGLDAMLAEEAQRPPKEGVYWAPSAHIREKPTWGQYLRAALLLSLGLTCFVASGWLGLKHLQKSGRMVRAKKVTAAWASWALIVLGYFAVTSSLDGQFSEIAKLLVIPPVVAGACFVLLKKAFSKDPPS